jgi:hypothetical protein
MRVLIGLLLWIPILALAQSKITVPVDETAAKIARVTK